MNSLDLFLLIPITLGFIFGLFKGLIKELISLVAIIAGIYGAKLFAPLVSEILITTFSFSPTTAHPTAYIILFIAIGIGLLLAANAIDKIFDSLSLGGLNKLLGGIFGALKYALIVSVLLNIFYALDSRFNIVKQQTKENSIAYKPLMKFGPALWEETKLHSNKPNEVGEK
jgi:membrane protein required for colicin V production